MNHNSTHLLLLQYIRICTSLGHLTRLFRRSPKTVTQFAFPITKPSFLSSPRLPLRKNDNKMVRKFLSFPVPFRPRTVVPLRVDTSTFLCPLNETSHPPSFKKGRRSPLRNIKEGIVFPNISWFSPSSRTSVNAVLVSKNPPIITVSS